MQMSDFIYMEAVVSLLPVFFTMQHAYALSPLIALLLQAALEREVRKAFINHTIIERVVHENSLSR